MVLGEVVIFNHASSRHIRFRLYLARGTAADYLGSRVVTSLRPALRLITVNSVVGGRSLTANNKDPVPVEVILLLRTELISSFD